MSLKLLIRPGTVDSDAITRRLSNVRLAANDRENQRTHGNKVDIVWSENFSKRHG